MYRAKERGRGRYELFDEEMRQHAFSRLRTESDLRRAVEREQFRVALPADLRRRRGSACSGSRRSCAGTARGNGIVGPAEFIGLTEETGLIAPLGALGARAGHRAGRASGASATRTPPTLGVTVNVSGRQLARPEFLDEVQAALGRCGLPPEQPRPRDHRERADEGRLLAALHARGAARAAACASCSTTSAPATRRSRASRACRSTRSRSTARSSTGSPPRTRTPRSCRRSSTSRAASA